jgi:predicted PurR-regulated permease PerM
MTTEHESGSHAAPSIGGTADRGGEGRVTGAGDDDAQVFVVPARLVWAGGIAWRLLAVVAAAAVAGWLAWRLRVVVLPVFIALGMATVLVPPARWLRRRGWPPLLATWAVFLAAVAVAAGVVALVAPPFVNELDALGEATSEAVDDMRAWLVDGPLGLSEDQIDKAVDDATAAAEARSEDLAAVGVSGVLIVADLLVGAIVAIVLTFFFVKDGERITAWILDQVRPRTATDLREVGERIWRTVTGYFRGVAVNGLIEATLIGGGLAIMGVPLVIPLTVITFFGGFFPLVGALVAGALAAMVALVTQGFGTAVAVIVLAVVVQNLVSNLFDPLVMSRAVHLHPVVVLAVVTSGGILGGIIGAFIAVPLAAVVANVGDYYLHAKPERAAAGAEAGAGAAPDG